MLARFLRRGLLLRFKRAELRAGVDDLLACLAVEKAVLLHVGAGLFDLRVDRLVGIALVLRPELPVHSAADAGEKSSGYRTGKIALPQPLKRNVVHPVLADRLSVVDALGKRRDKIGGDLFQTLAVHLPEYRQCRSHRLVACERSDECLGKLFLRQILPGGLDRHLVCHIPGSFRRRFDGADHRAIGQRLVPARTVFQRFLDRRAGRLVEEEEALKRFAALFAEQRRACDTSDDRQRLIADTPGYIHCPLPLRAEVGIFLIHLFLVCVVALEGGFYALFVEPLVFLLGGALHGSRAVVFELRYAHVLVEILLLLRSGVRRYLHAGFLSRGLLPHSLVVGVVRRVERRRRLCAVADLVRSGSQPFLCARRGLFKDARDAV